MGWRKRYRTKENANTTGRRNWSSGFPKKIFPRSVAGSKRLRKGSWWNCFITMAKRTSSFRSLWTVPIAISLRRRKWRLLQFLKRTRSVILIKGSSFFLMERTSGDLGNVSKWLIGDRYAAKKMDPKNRGDEAR